MKLEELQEQLTAFLNQHGIQAMASWPKGRRHDKEEPVVLVSLESLECGPSAMQDYLGQTLDEKTGIWQELYGRKAAMTFALDVLAVPSVGAQACRMIFGQMMRAFQLERPMGLNVRELTGQEPEYDEKEGLIRLRCHLECCGWLCAMGDEQGTFLDFTLRGDVNT